MNTLAQAIRDTSTTNDALTANGARTLASSESTMLDLFSIIGSARNNRDDAVKQFKLAYSVDPKTALQILLWSRDARGGAGERETFRQCLAVLPSATLLKIIDAGVIEELGRWDDYIGLLTSSVEIVAQRAATRVLAALKAGNGLCAKWLPRKGVAAAQIRRLFKMSPKLYRKTLVELTQVVENKMCARDWENIRYEHVPSVAMARYTRAFGKRSTVAFPAYKAALANGTVEAKASVLFPYDVCRTVTNGDAAIADAQWKALPNYIDGPVRLLPMIDVSTSMAVKVSGSVSAMNIAVSLGLYLAERNQSAFKDMFMTFSAEPTMEVLRPGTIAERMAQTENADWGGNTDLQAAFKLLLRTAVQKRVPAADMPTHLFIVSDMEFDRACGFNAWMELDDRRQLTNFEAIEAAYRDAGYTRPNIIFWNVVARGKNVQTTVDESGTAMLSGFSPSIVRAVLNAETVTPQMVMEATINKPRYLVPGLTCD